MPKDLMNEAEQFLVKRWAEARELEESMERVRTKYKELLGQVVEALRQTYPVLDCSVVYTQFWNEGSIGVGRQAWPPNNSDGKCRSGFWLGNLRLEVLASEDSEPPYASISVPKKLDLDLHEIQATLNAAAKELLSSDELKRMHLPESGDDLPWFEPAGKSELLELVCRGDGQNFVKRLLTEFELLARFIPALDKLLKNSDEGK